MYFLATPAPTTPAPTCPDDWLDSDHGCFNFASEVDSMTWHEAKDYCESQNAYLAEVLTSEAQTFLEIHGTSLPATNWWLGATNQETVSTKMRLHNCSNVST